MKALKEQLHECEAEMASINKRVEKIKEQLVEESNLKINDKVKRLDGIGDEFYISRIWYDTDDEVLLYGIKTNPDNLYDNYACLRENKLIKL